MLTSAPLHHSYHTIPFLHYYITPFSKIMIFIRRLIIHVFFVSFSSFFHILTLFCIRNENVLELNDCVEFVLCWGKFLMGKRGEKKERERGMRDTGSIPFLVITSSKWAFKFYKLVFALWYHPTPITMPNFRLIILSFNNLHSFSFVTIQHSCIEIATKNVY